MPTVASQLGITQPAVSAAVRELEASLGMLLFERTPKGMLPTGHVETLALHVTRALAELRDARDEITSLRGTTKGTVAVGALPLGRTLILKPRATLQAVAREGWVLPRPGNPTRDPVAALFAKRGIKAPDVRVETSDLAVLRGVLLESDLMTAITARQLDHEFRTGLLRALPIALPEASRQIGITRRSADVPSPGARLLMDEIRVVASDLDR